MYFISSTRPRLFVTKQMAPELEPLLDQHGIDIENTPVWPTIHQIRADAIHFIDTPLSYEALTAPDLTYTLIRPLHEKYIVRIAIGANASGFHFF